MFSSIFFLLCFLAFYCSTQHAANNWYSIIPPLLAVTLALITHRVILSIALGILVGGYLTAWHAPTVGPWLVLDGISTSGQWLWGAVAQPSAMHIILAVVFILSTVSISISAGGLKGVINCLAKYANNSHSSQLVTYSLGLLVFMDDYANTMIVGSAMRPVTDSFRVSREKLAFIVDSTAAPIAGLAFISTWVGFEVSQLQNSMHSAGVALNGFAIFFDIFTFRFYCMMMIIFVFINILSKRDFGPMYRAQLRAQTEGLVASADAKPLVSKNATVSEPLTEARVNLWSAALPLIGLLTCFIVGLWFDGGGGAVFNDNPWSVLSFNSWFKVVSHAENSLLMFLYAGITGFVLALGCALLLAKLSLQSLVRVIFLGVRSSILPIVILTSAWTLKAACDAVHTDQYLLSLMGDNITVTWLPIMVFLLAGVIAFATGTSWGTMAILIPIVTPLALQLEGSYGLITMLSLAAVLDGAIFGDHCSPLSDTTILSSISTSCDHMHHVETQMPYAMTVASAAAITGYLPATFGLHWSLSLLLAALIFSAIFFLLKFGDKSCK